MISEIIANIDPIAKAIFVNLLYVVFALLAAMFTACWLVNKLKKKLDMD